MLSIGCIQAQRCHTGRCPTGVATQSRWLMRGLDPDLKHARAANYIVGLRGELLSLARACGARHPALVDAGRIEVVDPGFRSRPLREVFGLREEWPVLSPARREEIEALVDGPAPRPEPGPQAGEDVAPRVGEPGAEHSDD
jgi:hypothetical protein